MTSLTTAAQLILTWIAFVSCQDNIDEDTRRAINNVFSTESSRGSEFLPGYEEVTRKDDGGSIGALEKCGEGSDAGKHICVPYYQCDGVTRTVVQNGVTDGFGVIDIRFGANACPHFLDTCCGVPPGFDPTTIVKEPSVPEPVNQPDGDGDGNGGSTSTSTTSRPTTETTTRRFADETLSFSRCGIRNPNGIDFKITGDKDNEAEYGEFPWMLAILKKNYDPSSKEPLALCGGSVLAPNIVLTGAHCVYKFKTNELRIRAGEWDTQTTKERLPYQERDVSKILIHENFNPQTLFNDIALLILEKSFDAAENVATICLPEENEVINSKNCFASGWGKDVFGKLGQFQVILKKIELPLVQRRECERGLRTTRLGQHFNLHDSFICAGGEAGKDTCTGDGGSPLVCPDPKNNQRYVQAGIVAWGIGCGEHNVPGVYADVAKLRKWINDKLSESRLTLNN